MEYERRPTIDGVMEYAVGAMMTSEVGDDRACQLRDPADPGGARPYRERQSSITAIVTAVTHTEMQAQN